MGEEAEMWMRDRLSAGRMEYGCTHYRRRCRIRAPCCNEVYQCRHCHNEAMSRLSNPKERHELPRNKIERVICSLCDTEQSVKQECENCGVNMGEYYCAVCKFFDDDVSKEQYHCDDCGICRVGGRDKFFHCNKCGCCYSVGLQKAHSCVENSMHHNCPVCFEYLFDSLKDITVLQCGHTMHMECLSEMKMHSQYSCPMCSKSVCDMSRIWERLDLEVAATPMPLEYQDKTVWILCNDCGKTSEVHFHIVAQKCLICKSYNTRQIREP
ncbi:hypothetical protein SUGI_0843910 [Cryptomeria japonica]|uniref:E3 ubiquitin-protein ligase MIEL1 isoform X1 n=1 Tax=Cryptomeria japonica TaxID=3369 RepID=UPI002414BE54|nr:E3 ubiquitin-protein ligase MIEL1 isoform X1 [Cryptomeria japonica]GLJ40798.1 hypothetical protein SUGI_0843910 [Cryptomeria japonica]